MRISNNTAHSAPFPFVGKGAWMLLLMLWLSLPSIAQDDYNPGNPADPYMKYRVTASVTPEGAGSISGVGKYAVGTQVWMNTSASSTDYKFQYWEKDGVKCSESKSFYYTMTAENADFVAVYTYEPNEDFVVYDPANPADPNVVPKPEIIHTYYTLNLVASPAEACSFNLTSGLSVEEDTYVKIESYGNQNYDFVGWYRNGTKVSSSEVFNYLMTFDATLTAMYKEYNPENPDDPTSSMENTSKYKKGDVNGDGNVNVSDAVDLITYYLNNTTSELSNEVADVDGNGGINVSDAIEIIQVYLNNR